MWRYIAMGLAVGMAVYFGQEWRLGAQLSDLKATRATELQAASDAAYGAREAYDKLKKTADGERDEIRSKQQVRDAATQVAIDSAAAQLGSLRKQLAAATAASRGQPATGTDAGPVLDGSSTNADTLRYVVGECAARYVRVAGVADQLSGQVTDLLAYAGVLQSYIAAIGATRPVPR